MEEKNMIPERNGNIFSQALKAVKGENSQQLIEQFTAEMTLVAEGLFEDQGKIRQKIDHLEKETDRRIQQANAQNDENNKLIEEERKYTDQKIKELSIRMQELEKTLKNQKQKHQNFMSQLTTVVIILSVSAVIITLLTKLL